MSWPVTPSRPARASVPCGSCSNSARAFSSRIRVSRKSMISEKASTGSTSRDTCDGPAPGSGRGRGGSAQNGAQVEVEVVVVLGVLLVLVVLDRVLVELRVGVLLVVQRGVHVHLGVDVAVVATICAGVATGPADASVSSEAVAGVVLVALVDVDLAVLVDGRAATDA